MDIFLMNIKKIDIWKKRNRYLEKVEIDLRKIKNEIFENTNWTFKKKYLKSENWFFFKQRNDFIKRIKEEIFKDVKIISKWIYKKNKKQVEILNSIEEKNYKKQKKKKKNQQKNKSKQKNPTTNKPKTHKYVIKFEYIYIYIYI